MLIHDDVVLAFLKDRLRIGPTKIANPPTRPMAFVPQPNDGARDKKVWLVRPRRGAQFNVRAAICGTPRPAQTAALANGQFADFACRRASRSGDGIIFWCTYFRWYANSTPGSGPTIWFGRREGEQ
ncbi:MAG TPA: hypothetical protein VHY91_27595 [Pirellulales bacterium]|jgi:hypothetical protein|nr:hypothetical protein [Pirellulales bacterium]